MKKLGGSKIETKLEVGTLFGQTPYQQFRSTFGLPEESDGHTSQTTGDTNEDEEEEEEAEEGEEDLLGPTQVSPEIEADAQLLVETPAELSVPLYQHQKQGLGWMVSREASVSRGGLLADEMGLGKTLQVIALLCHNKPYLPERKTTLVVAPVAIVSQWRAEIKDHTLPYKLNVYTYHGDRRVKDVKFLAKHDVVITSYATLTSDFSENVAQAGPLFQVYWFRVVLDESHCIKNKDSRTTQACLALQAVRRWCVSGTPIQTRMRDLFSTMKFLKLRPYDDYSTFRQLTRNCVTESDRKRLRTVLSTFMLRRLKAKVLTVAQVPNKRVSIMEVVCTEKEKALYHCLESEAQVEVKRLLRVDTLSRQSTNIFVLLLRLRQASNHVDLVPNVDDLVQALGGWGAVEKRWKAFVESATKPDLSVGVLSSSVIVRLMRVEDLSASECPICIDVCENAVVTKCGHVFCRGCLHTFLTSDGEFGTKPCPECRQGITESELTAVTVVEQKQREVRLAKKSQLSSSSVADNDSWRDRYGSKITTLVEYLEKAHQETDSIKTIVFTQFTGMLDLAEQALQQRQLNCLRYDGDMEYAEQERVLEQFKQDPHETILLMSLKCGACGLNLSHASRVVLLDASWNPFIEEQAIDRVHRIGQTHEVEVVRFIVPGSVEDRILSLQETKKLAAGAFMDQGASFARMTKQDLQVLFNLK